jgi:membrane-associated phospholipid phosphatase
MLVELFKSMDYGGYYFFRHLARQNPEILPAFRLGDWLGSYFVVGFMFLVAVILLLVQARTRAAQVSVGAFVLGVIFVEILRNVVAAHRPPDAQDLVDADEMLRSFPAREVFTVTLAGVLLLFAAWGSVRKTPLRLLLTAAVVVLLLWVAMSQLILGLHFVTDVMGGLAGGIGLGLLASRFFPAWFNSRGFQVASPRELGGNPELGPYLDDTKLPPNLSP